MFADCFNAFGIRHMVRDGKTGELHLWCCLPSGIYWEWYRPHLLIALDRDLSVLRYTFHTGEWNWMKMDRGMSIFINFQSFKTGSLRQHRGSDSPLGRNGKRRQLYCGPAWTDRPAAGLVR